MKIFGLDMHAWNSGVSGQKAEYKKIVGANNHSPKIVRAGLASAQ